MIPPRIRRQFGNSIQIQPQVQIESMVSLNQILPKHFSNHKIKLNPWSNHIHPNSIKYFSYHKFFQGVIHSLKVQSNYVRTTKGLIPKMGYVGSLGFPRCSRNIKSNSIIYFILHIGIKGFSLSKEIIIKRYFYLEWVVLN